MLEKKLFYYVFPKYFFCFPPIFSLFLVFKISKNNAQHCANVINEKNNADKKLKNKLLSFMNSPFQLPEVVCGMTSALHIHSITTIPISCVKCFELNSIEM
jgi:hypothetical protein